MGTPGGWRPMATVTWRRTTRRKCGHVECATNLPDMISLGVQMIIRGGHVQYANDLPNLLRLTIRRRILLLHRSFRLLMCQMLLIVCQGCQWRNGLG